MRQFYTLGILALLISPAVLALSACNTMEGVGEDLGSAGSSLEQSAERHKDY